MADQIEPARPTHHTKIPYWRLVIDHAGVTPEVANYPYEGSGTEDDPYLVQWIPNDPRNPMEFSAATRWFITLVVAIATLAVALASSAYSGGVSQIMVEFQISQQVAILGVSLFVLGFAVGPLLWAPLSELFGRQYLFFGTYAALTAFNAGCAGAQTPATLMVLRFFAGAFGSSPLTNSGGVIADMFPAAERGQAMGLFAIAPFLGPVLGPITGGFLGVGAGWRWIMGFLAIFSGVLWLLGGLLVPETYAPVLLRKRAMKLSAMTGKHYVSSIDKTQGRVPMSTAFKIALSRPWILLFREPIVLLLSVYMAIIYGTLYMLFAAFPIVYQRGRGWSAGIGGLAFLGIMVGMFFAVAYASKDNKRYIAVSKRHRGFAPPETRVPPMIVGSVFLPIGLFWFAWTNSPDLHWMISIAAGVPFGFGMVLVFLTSLNYLIDSYTIFAASVLAANSVLRSLFGAAFPLFTTYMYDDLGIHWASSIPAFLALACVPFPFLFYKYGASIRQKCKYAAQSAAFMKSVQEQAAAAAAAAEGTVGTEKRMNEKQVDADGHTTRGDDSTRVSTSDTQSDDHADSIDVQKQRRNRRASNATVGTRDSVYDANPYNIDRVNTRQSFR